MPDAHPPRQAEPAAGIVLAPNSIVRDALTGEQLSSEAWLDRLSTAEQRPRDECVDALMNAIARGDLSVEPDVPTA